MTITHDFDREECKWCDDASFGAFIYLEKCPHCKREDRLVRNFKKKHL